MGDALPQCVEIPAPGAHRWSVIWLHGLGADGHDFEAIVPELRLPADHGVRFVFPHAPQRPVTVNGGMRMRAWYDIAGADLAAKEDEAGIAESAALVEALIERERALGVPASRIVLAGFSQGGAVALHAGLRHAERLGGILALSAYLLLGERLGSEMSAAELGYRFGHDAGRDGLLIRAAMAGDALDRGDLTALERGAQAVFPVAAADLKPAFTGPALGQRLRALEARWIASGFTLTREDLL